MDLRKTLFFACLAQCCGVLCFIGIKNLGLPFLLKSLNYDDSTILLMVSSLSIFNVFHVFLSVFLSGRRIKYLLIFNYLIGHLFLAAICVGYYFDKISALLLIIGVFGYFFFTGLGDTFWWPFIHPQIPQLKVSDFFTRLRVTWATFSFLGVIALKNIANGLVGPKEFSIFIFFMGIFGACRMIFLSPLKIKGAQNFDDPLDFKKFIKLIKKFKNYHELYFIFFFVFFEPLFFGTALVLYLNDLGVSQGDNFLVGGVGLLSTIISLLFVNNQLKKVEEKTLVNKMKIPVIVNLALIPCVSLIPQREIIIFVVIFLKFFMGLISAGANLIYINKLFNHIDPRNRTVSMGVFNLAIFVVFFVSEFFFSWCLRISKNIGVFENKFILPFLVYFLIGVIFYFYQRKKHYSK